VFATIIGPYPGEGAASDTERLTGVLGDQLEGGLGLLTDGRVHGSDDGPARVVDAWRAADAVGRHLSAEAGLEPPLIKACMLGPWSAARGERARVAPATDAIVPVIEALFEAGAPVVQVTEPGIGDIDSADLGAIELVSEVLERIATPFAVPDRHLSLALAGGGPTRVPAERLLVGFSSYLLDLIASPDDWDICARVPGGAGLIVGVVDARAARPGAAEVGVWGARYAASMGGRGPARTGICPGSGIERLDRAAARALLAFTADVARKGDLPDSELMREVDPASVDARSAALGRSEPRARGGRRSPGR
jgi:hypothetical protein